jgi:uncharacterized Zn-binding protein involved in type VI secretion
MSKAVQRVGDRNSAGGVIVNGDNSVLVNGRPVAVLNSRVTPHPCCGADGCPPVHCNAQTTNTINSVLINGRPIIVQGDRDTCAHPRVGGSTDVFASA